MYGNQGLKSGLIKPRKNANKSLTFTLTRGDTQVYSTTRSSLPVSTPIQSGSEDPGRGGITTSKNVGWTDMVRVQHKPPAGGQEVRPLKPKKLFSFGWTTEVANHLILRTSQIGESSSKRDRGMVKTATGQNGYKSFKVNV